MGGSLGVSDVVGGPSDYLRQCSIPGVGTAPKIGSSR